MCQRTQSYFNSIKVQLKLRIVKGFRHIIADFNSIKVQLKRHIRAHPYQFLQFQFHKGTIKTHPGMSGGDRQKTGRRGAERM